MKNDLIIFGAKYLFILAILIAALVYFKLTRNRRLQFAAAIILGGLLAVILVKILGKLYYHPRPFTLTGVKPLVSHAPDNGFPSEHATYTTVVATTLYFYRKQFAALAFIVAILVSYSRVLAHVHSTVDILAGIIAGVVAGICGYYLARQFFKESENV